MLSILNAVEYLTRVLPLILLQQIICREKLVIDKDFETWILNIYRHLKKQYLQFSTTSCLWLLRLFRFLIPTFLYFSSYQTYSREKREIVQILWKHVNFSSK